MKSCQSVARSYEHERCAADRKLCVQLLAHAFPLSAGHAMANGAEQKADREQREQNEIDVRVWRVRMADVANRQAEAGQIATNDAPWDENVEQF